MGHAGSDHHGSRVLRLPELDVHVVARRSLGFLGRLCWRVQLPLVVSASDGSSRKVLQPSFFASEVNTPQAWLFWPRDDQLIVRLPGQGPQLADGDGTNLRAMPDDLLLPESSDGRWTLGAPGSDLMIMAQDNTVKARATFASEQFLLLGWAPDSSILTISFNSPNNGRNIRFDHLGLFGIDGRVSRVDVPDGIDFVPRDIRGLPGDTVVHWAPDSSRLVAYGTIVGRDGRLLGSVRDADMAVWSWDSHHLAVAGPTSPPAQRGGRGRFESEGDRRRRPPRRSTSSSGCHRPRAATLRRRPSDHVS